MAAIERQGLLRDGSLSSNSEEVQIDEDSAASLLQSVKEQEQQFALLSKEIEEERKNVAQQLNDDQHGQQDYDGNMDSSAYHNNPNGDIVTETFSRKENYSDPKEETEVLVDENGVSKTITKRIVTKTVTEKRVRRIEDTESLPRNNHSDLRPGSHSSSSDSERQYNSIQQSHDYRYSPVEDETRGLLQRRSSESSSSSEGKAKEPSGYSLPQPSRGMMGSTDEVRKRTQPEKFQPEDYGLEDDRRSDYNDDDDQYGLEPTSYIEEERRKSISSSSVESDSSRKYDEQLDGLPTAAPRIAPKSHAGRAPLAMQEAGSRASLDRLGPDWQTPTLEEVIKMLSYNMPVVQKNSAGYLQHLCFNDDKVKADVKTLGGIPPLIKLLDHGHPQVEHNACGALKNLCHGSKNDKNKIEIKKHEGVPAVVKLIRSTKNIETREQATGTLWNLSAHPELKGQVIELGLEPLTNHIIIPYADTVAKEDSKPKDVAMVDVFANSAGVVRNLSSTDSQENRRKLRECEGLLQALISVIQANKERGDIDNKCTENCMCVLRNLAFKLQDETPNSMDLYMLEKPKDTNDDKSNTSCFGKKKESQPEVVEEIPPDNPDAENAELLWQPGVSSLCVALLKDCHRQEIIEAALGALQNLTSGVWKWAIYARAAVRKEKGLPVIIDRLRTDNDQIVRVGTIALTNLAEDFKNKELIGKFSMKDLVYKLPGGTDPNVRHSDRTVIAILNTIRILVEKSPENVKHLRDAGGIERITTINNTREQGRFQPRVVKSAGQVLKTIWSNKETRSLLKKDGWNKNHFTPTVTVDTLPRNSGATSSRLHEDSRSSSGGRRAQRLASADEVEMTSQNPAVSSSSNADATATDSYV